MPEGVERSLARRTRRMSVLWAPRVTARRRWKRRVLGGSGFAFALGGEDDGCGVGTMGSTGSIGSSSSDGMVVLLGCGSAIVSCVALLGRLWERKNGRESFYGFLEPVIVKWIRIVLDVCLAEVVSESVTRDKRPRVKGQKRLHVRFQYLKKGPSSLCDFQSMDCAVNTPSAKHIPTLLRKAEHDIRPREQASVVPFRTLLHIPASLLNHNHLSPHQVNKELHSTYQD